jgi:hypothetical protein
MFDFRGDPSVSKRKASVRQAERLMVVEGSEADQPKVGCKHSSELNSVAPDGASNFVASLYADLAQVLASETSTL